MIILCNIEKQCERIKHNKVMMAYIIMSIIVSLKIVLIVIVIIIVHQNVNLTLSCNVSIYFLEALEIK